MYADLLSIVMAHENNQVDINVNVSISAVRKGLNKALQDINATNGLLGIEQEERVISVKELGDGNIRVSLVEADATTAHRFKPQFSFKIIGDSNGDEKD